MKRIIQRIARLSICAFSSTVLAASCTADLRDAVAVGTMEYISGTTTQLLGELINLSGGTAVDE